MPSRMTSLRSISLLTGASIVTLAIQFGYQLLLARYFGSSAEMDAYGAALTPPTVLSALLMGSLGYAFLPRFIESSKSHGDSSGWQLAASLGWSLTIGLAVLSAVAAVAARPLMAALYPGFSDAEVELTASLFRWLVWLSLTNSLIGFLQALHHARQSFFMPAAATVVGTTFTLGWTWLRAESGGIHAIVEGVVWGSAIAVAMQLPLYLRNCPWQIWLDHHLRKTVVLTVPLLLGGAYFKLEPLVDRYLASSMPGGTIAHLGYSKALVQALLLLTTSSLSIVLFPVISRLAAEGRIAELRHELERALQLLALLLVPLSAAIWYFGILPASAVFEWGKFTSADTHAVAVLLLLQLGIIVGGSLGEIFAKVFYATSDTRTPVLIGVAGFTLGLALKFLWRDRYGADGLVAASSVYLMVNAAIMGLILHRRLGGFTSPALGRTLLRSTVATALAAIIAVQVALQAGRPAILWAVMAGTVVYFVALFALREPLASEIGHAAGLRQRRHDGPNDAEEMLSMELPEAQAPATPPDIISDGRPLGS